MKELRLNAYAKVNLCLDILRRRPDDYHDIETVLHTVALNDTLTLRETSSGIAVRSDHAAVPTDMQNLIFRAAHVVRETFGVDRGVEIEVSKRIPTSSGLGGGSSDAAVTLVGLAQMWKLRLDARQMIDLATTLGSDVPFFLSGGAALATGRGERIRHLRPLPTTWVVIAHPDIEISTRWAYQHLDLDAVGDRPDTQGTVAALEREDVVGVAARLRNVFEPMIARHHPVVGELESALREAGALGASLSGTGPTVFALMPNERAARAAAEALARFQGVAALVTRTFAEQR